MDVTMSRFMQAIRHVVSNSSVDERSAILWDTLVQDMTIFLALRIFAHVA